MAYDPISASLGEQRPQKKHAATVLDAYLSQENFSSQESEEDFAIKSLESKTFKTAFQAIPNHTPQSDPSYFTAVKIAANTTKVLTPLLLAVGKTASEQSPEHSAQLITKALRRIKSDTDQVCSFFALNADQEKNTVPDWLSAQISGRLVAFMAQAIERDNGIFMEDTANSSYLQAFSDLAKRCAEEDLIIESSSYAMPNHWKVLESLSSATTSVLIESARFDYFYGDTAVLSEQISDFFNERVLLRTLEDFKERWNLDDDEQTYLSVSLLSSAGKIMCECWADGVNACIKAVKHMNEQERHLVLTTGYPLDPVFKAFERFYQGVEFSAHSALRLRTPHRENFSATDKTTSDLLPEENQTVHTGFAP